MQRSFLLLLLVAFLCQTSFAAPRTAEEWIAQGDDADRRLDTKAALASYLKAEALRPNDAALLIKIAKQYGESMVDVSDDKVKREAGATALAYAQRAVKAAPDLSDAHLAVSICYGRMLDLVPARTKVEYSREVKMAAERAVSLDSANDYAWHMLGRWHQAAADLNGLTKGLVRIVYGGLPESSFSEAETCFRKAMELNPGRLAHVVELGRTLGMKGQIKEARKYINQGLSMPSRERDDPGTKQRGKESLDGFR